jgi:hypothetical protein
MYSIWRQKIDIAVFKLSIGKNYVHPKIFTINSKCYTFFNNQISTVGFLNVGLLTGQSKGGTFRDNLPLWDIFNKITDPTEGALNRPLLIQHFLRYNREEIAKLTLNGEFNLFLSKLLGGIGFVLPPDCLNSVKFTHFQRSLAAYLNRSWKSIQDKPYKFGRSKVTPRLEFINVVTEIKNEVHSNFAGYDVIQAIPIRQPNPRGFGDKPEIKLPIMNQNYLHSSFRPNLKQQVFSRDILKNFRIALKTWHQEMDVSSCKYHAQGYDRRIVYRQFGCPLDIERARVTAHFRPVNPIQYDSLYTSQELDLLHVDGVNRYDIQTDEPIYLCGEVKQNFSDRLTLESIRKNINAQISAIVELTDSE